MSPAKKFCAITYVGLLVFGMVFYWIKNPAIQGVFWMSQGNYDKAIAAFNKAIEKQPNVAEFYAKRGLARLAHPARPDLNQALSDFNRSIELKPDMAEAFSNRAVIHIENEDYAAALSDLSCAERFELELPTEFQAIIHTNKGLVFSTMQEPAKAIVELDKAIEINPKYGPAYGNRAVAHAKLGHFDKATLDCHKALKYDPRSAYKACGLVKLLQGRDGEAEQDFQKHLEINPGYAADLRKAIARTRQYLNERDSAER